MSKPLVIVGAGGHGRVSADVASAMGLHVAGFVDSNPSLATVNSLPVVAREIAELGNLWPPDRCSVFIGIGNNTRRLQLYDEATRLGYELPVLIHPFSWISEYVTLETGSVAMAGVVINANTSVGQCCIINTGASLDHDNTLGRGVQICPGVRSAGGVTFGDAAFVGTGAVIIPGQRVGCRAVVGAGAVVVRNVADDDRVIGNPARLATSRYSGHAQRDR